MGEINVARLKARLSAYVRRVRKGETFTVLSRDIPVARIVPVGTSSTRLSVRTGSGRPGQVTMPPPIRTGVDVVDLLVKDREAGR